MNKARAADPHLFDPEAVDFLHRAFEEAWQQSQARKPLFDGDAEGARAALAAIIMDAAKKGERDRQKLIEGALVRFRL